MEETKTTKRNTLSGERISAIQHILFPYGCSILEDGNYMVGASPSLNGENNVIGLRVRIKEDQRYADFELIMHYVAGCMSNKDLYGYYCGIMSILVPDACPIDNEFNTTMNVLQFRLLDEEELRIVSTFNVHAEPIPF